MAPKTLPQATRKIPLIAAGLLFYSVLAMRVPQALAAGPERDAVTVDEQTEGVIHGALQYLAKQQGLNGSWSQGQGGQAEPVAITAFTLMAFLSTGNLPGDGEYGKNVAAGMQYLLNQIQPDGLFRDVQQGHYMYSHGIATVALSEIYGQTNSPVLRERLTRIVNVIVNAQSGPGGWRYTPTSKDADISVTVMQVAALRAAKNAGLAVPQDTIDRAVAYIGTCYNSRDGGFAYQPNGEAGFARTAAAIYSLQVCGQYKDAHVAPASDYILAHGDDRQKWWPYGCYYATPAEYMLGGDSWPRWYGQMKSSLLASVTRDGDTAYWRRSYMLGPVYETAVFVTILAMPWHYIPLYQR